MKIIKTILFPFLTLGIVACSVDPNLPFDLDESLENNGAFLRINSVEIAAFDLADIDNAAFQMNVEYFDKEVGKLLDNIEFSVSYTNFHLDSADRIDIPQSEPFMSLTPGDFEPGDKGLPTTTVTIPFTEVISALGLTQEEVGVEDRFTISWVINLTDGRSFSGQNSSPAVTGGSFFSAPGQANVFTVQALDETEFVGTYRFTQTAPGPIAGLGLSYIFGETFEAELSVDPDNTLNGRIFSVEPYPEFGGLSQVTVPIAIGRTATVAPDNIGTGIGCSEGLSFGSPTSSDNLVEINVDDDSQFTLVLTENKLADCGVGPGDVVLQAEKIN